MKGLWARVAMWNTGHMPKPATPLVAWHALVAVLSLMTLLVGAAGCDDSAPAPSVKATCERLETLCGQLHGFEAGQCEALAEMGAEPTSAERRCVGKADTCDEAFACQSGDAGRADASL